jgi:hypothetical protein
MKNILLVIKSRYVENWKSLSSFTLLTAEAIFTLLAFVSHVAELLLNLEHLFQCSSWQIFCFSTFLFCPRCSFLDLLFISRVGLVVELLLIICSVCYYWCWILCICIIALVWILFEYMCSYFLHNSLQIFCIM